MRYHQELDLNYLFSIQCKIYFMAENLLQAVIYIHSFYFVLLIYKAVEDENESNSPKTGPLWSYSAGKCSIRRENILFIITIMNKQSVCI